MNALQKAEINIKIENPDFPMRLKFDVTSKEIIKNLLKFHDLTLPSRGGVTRNIIGIVYDSVVENLKKYNFQDIKVIRKNPIVSAEDNFDNLLFTPGNPSRSATYTRYIDENHVLRTHTSAAIPGLYSSLDKSKIDNSTFVIPGLVYRRDVIDPRHIDVFHQIDIWTLKDNQKYGATTREDLLVLVKVVFEAACPDAEMILYEAVHPYTVNGIEVYAKVDGREIEVFEAGLVHPQVLINAGIDPEKFSGLALGMGVERLIMARKKLPDIRLIRSVDPRIQKQMSNLDPYKNVSSQPVMSRDMSYCISKYDTEEDVCEAIRLVFGEKSDLLEEVTILERTPFSNLLPNAIERLGATPDLDNILVRISLRHPDKTLTKAEAVKLYDMAYPKLHKGLSTGYKA